MKITRIPLRMNNPEEIAVSILDKTTTSTSACFNLINAASFSNFVSNRPYLDAIKVSNFNFVDGKPLSLYLSAKFGIPQNNSRGMDIFKKTMELLVYRPSSNLFVFFEREDVDELRRYLSNFLDSNQIVVLEIDDKLSLDNIAELITKKSKEFNISIIWLMIGSPRQEIVSHVISDNTDCPIIGVGGVIDFITGKAKEAPNFVRLLYLEWLFRFFQEPRRLFIRYSLGNIHFLKAIFFDFVIYVTNRLRLNKDVLAKKHEIYLDINC